MKALLINPFDRTISEIDIKGDLDSIQNAVFSEPAKGCTVTVASIEYYDSNLDCDISIDLWVDDDGLLKNNKLTQIADYPQLLAGKILALCVDDEGECQGLPETWAASLRAQVTWSDSEVVYS